MSKRIPSVLVSSGMLLKRRRFPFSLRKPSQLRIVANPVSGRIKEAKVAAKAPSLEPNPKVPSADNVNAPNVSEAAPAVSPNSKTPPLATLTEALSLSRSRSVPLSKRVPPALITILLVFPSAPFAAAASFPALMVVVPEKLLSPKRTTFPPPVLLRPKPFPEISAEISRVASKLAH